MNPRLKWSENPVVQAFCPMKDGLQLVVLAEASLTTVLLQRTPIGFRLDNAVGEAKLRRSSFQLKRMRTQNER